MLQMLALSGWRVLGRAARPLQANRNIFSHSRLDIDPSLFASSNDAIGPKQATMKEIIQNNFKTSRLKKVLVDDVDKFLSLSVTTSDLQLAKEMVAGVAADEVLGVLHPAGATELFLNYNRACHLLGRPQEATAAWEDSRIMERFVLKEGVACPEAFKSLGIYMDLLLDSGQYDEVVEMFLRHKEALTGSGQGRPPGGLPVRLVLLALYKQRTEQALTTSVHILDRFVRNSHTQQHNPHRDSIGSVACLAFDLGEYAKALAILDRYSELQGKAKGTLLLQSMRMMCLAKCDRLDEAVVVLKKEFLPRRDRFDAVVPGKRMVLYAAVECVVAAVASDKDLFNDVMRTVEKIEDNSEVIGLAIEEFLFRKIDNEKVTEVINKDDI
jgi:hypothetical protein